MRSTLRLVVCGHETGAGFIWRDDGLVVTTAHQLRGEQHCAFGALQGAPYRRCTVLGTDTTADVALLKVYRRGEMFGREL